MHGYGLVGKQIGIRKCHCKYAGITVKNHLRYTPVCGDFVDDVIQLMVKMATDDERPVHAKFNGDILIANPNDDAKTLIARRKKELARIAQKWRESPEGRQALAEQERRIREEDAHNAHKTYKTLPRFFQKWVRERRGKEYGRELDVIIAHDALLLAKHFKTVEALDAFLINSIKSWEKEVPEVAHDHSGFSGSRVEGLARKYLGLGMIQEEFV